jgi:hypothetical protein
MKRIKLVYSVVVRSLFSNEAVTCIECPQVKVLDSNYLLKSTSLIKILFNFIFYVKSANYIFNF